MALSILEMTDIGGIDDVSASLAMSSGRRLFAEQLLRRLTTTRGALWYDPAYGFNLRTLIGATLAMPAHELESEIARELQKEDGVSFVSARVAYDMPTRTLTVTISVTDDLQNTFPLIAKVDDVSIELLSGVT